MVLAVDYEPMLEMGNMLMIFNNISNAILFGSPFFGLYFYLVGIQPQHQTFKRFCA